MLGPLLEAARAGRGFDDVPSAVFRREGEVIANELALVDDDAPFLRPDYGLVDLGEYARHSSRHPYIFPGFTPVEPGRGCANRSLRQVPPGPWWPTGSIRRPREPPHRS